MEYLSKLLVEYKETDNFIFAFENGKCVRVPVSAYQTKSNRKKLTGAYSDASPIAGIAYEDSPCEVFIGTDQNRCIVVNSALISQKTTRSSQGVTVVKNKKNEKVSLLTTRIDKLCGEDGSKGFKKTKLPAPATPFGKRIDRLFKNIADEPKG